MLIQLHGHDVMSQKERLLNLALDALPAHCRKVVWLDCDVLFVARDWPQRLDALLDRHPVVQAFRSVHHVAAEWSATAAAAPPLFAQPPVLAQIAEAGIETLASRIPSGPGSSNKGTAWAARRALVAEHGLYDACIIGGGDLAFVPALRAARRRDARHERAPIRALRALGLALAQRRARNPRDARRHGASSRHGDVGDRGYRERHEGLLRYDFDPALDIALDGNGAWRWNTDKPALHEYVRRYFVARREDG